MQSLGWRSLLVAAAVLLCLESPAAGDVVHYIGPHPVAPQIHKGMCQIQGPHVHVYKPHKPLLYVEVDAGWVFTGDPVEFDRKAPKYVYYDHHPVFWTEYDDNYDDYEPHHYCYISGPHHHLYAPPPRLKFKLKGGVYWYVGGHPKWYRKRRLKHRHVDEYYTSVRIARPTVTVTPPSGFIGVSVGPGGGHVHGHVQGGVHVAPPSVQVNVPAPFVDINIGGGGRVRRVHRAPRYRVKRRGPPSHAPAWGRRGYTGKAKYKSGVKRRKIKVKRKGKGKWK